MRLKVSIQSLDSFVYNEINNYFIQSMIWDHLKKSDFEKLHNYRGFKFFSFSNIFPVEDITENKVYYLIISSPNEELIKVLKEKFQTNSKIHIGKHEFRVEECKTFNIPLRRKWITGSPIVLYKNNDLLEYFSFERYKDFEFFFNRIKDNSIKKYKAYYNIDKFEFKFFMFESFKFKRTVIHSLRKNKNRFVVIGTLGEFTLPQIHSRRIKQFYEFLQDTGLGEKNSLGYGFINPKR